MYTRAPPGGLAGQAGGPGGEEGKSGCRRRPRTQRTGACTVPCAMHPRPSRPRAHARPPCRHGITPCPRPGSPRRRRTAALAGSAARCRHRRRTHFAMALELTSVDVYAAPRAFSSRASCMTAQWLHRKHAQKSPNGLPCEARAQTAASAAPPSCTPRSARSSAVQGCHTWCAAVHATRCRCTGRRKRPPCSCKTENPSPCSL